MADSSLFPTAVRVDGLRETNAALGKIDKALQREYQGKIRHLAEPAADLIRREARGHRFTERTVSGIRAGSSRGHAVVRQARGKVTGKRSDFGSTQYREAFMPGAEKAEPIVREGVEDFLERITTEAGF